MSALYLRGLKQGDFQLTATGVATAALFFFLSQAKPVSKLSIQKPPSSVFCPSVISSIGLQFLVHLVCLLCTLWLCDANAPVGDSSIIPDGRFTPNVFNTSVFLLSTIMQVNNFFVNYRGHPFTLSIRENKSLWVSLLSVYAVVFICCTETFEPLNDLLQLFPLPNPEFRSLLLCILAVDFSACWVVENFCQKLEK